MGIHIVNTNRTPVLGVTQEEDETHDDNQTNRGV
jgi:hypothetical protein